MKKKYEKPEACLIQLTGKKDIVMVSRPIKFKGIESYHCSQSHGGN